MNDGILDIVVEVDKDIRVHPNFKPGHVVPQGDIYLHMLSGGTDKTSIQADRKELETRLRKNWSDFRLGKLGEITNVRQLVQGNSIGSRHSIDGNATIYAPDKGATPLEGPVIVAHEKCRLIHPEHAHHEIPEGTYQVVFQRDFITEEIQRVTD